MEEAVHQAFKEKEGKPSLIRYADDLPGRDEAEPELSKAKPSGECPTPVPYPSPLHREQWGGRRGATPEEASSRTEQMG